MNINIQQNTLIGVRTEKEERQHWKEICSISWTNQQKMMPRPGTRSWKMKGQKFMHMRKDSNYIKNAKEYIIVKRLVHTI